ncbi:MAG: hypothetical protein AB7P33_15650, partial [Dehalococcoidia bacterium]
YLGIAFGTSLQSGGGGGGSNNAAGNLPTRPAGITEAACPGPITLNQGARVSLTFSTVPEGYTLNPSPPIRPISPTAAVTQVEATSQQGNSILFAANIVPDSAGRTDEYRVIGVFAKGSDRQQIECTVRVAGPAGAPTPAAPTATQPPAASPTNTVVPPTATRPAVIQPTAVPTTVPTEAPPTATPDLSTPTPSVPTPVPTSGGQLISPTQVPTVAPTVAPSPTPLPPLN